MPRRKQHEEHENHEAWAIPYGDLVTLLLAFFVVMYAMSSVNEGKYRVLSNSLSEAFNGTPHNSSSDVSEHVTPIDQLPIDQVHKMIEQGLPVQLSAKNAVVAGSHPADKANAAPPVTPPAAADAAPLDPPPPPNPNAAESAALNKVADDVTAAMGPLIAAGQVHVHRYDNWVTVDISTDILFVSGDAHLGAPAATVLQHLADTLKPWPNSIRVEGHTDDRPIRTAAYPSNWELSAARAASVVHLFMDHGISPGRLAVIGFGETRPSSPNTTLAGRNANRRVEVVILGRDNAPEGHL